MSAEEAIKAWIRAEWEFRLGPRAYSEWAQDLFTGAEDNLRKALTGSATLVDAYSVLVTGKPMPPVPVKPLRRARLNLHG